MKTAAILLALFSAQCTMVGAQLQLKFGKQRGQTTAAAAARRSNTMKADLFWAELTYVVNATVGTPGQDVSLILATSSYDTWVVDARSYYCSYTPSDSSIPSSTSISSTKYCEWGSFSPGNSTSVYLNATALDTDYSSDDYFSVSYVDGTYADGIYMNDAISLGGVTVSNLTMGLVNETSHFIGVLGIGYNDSTYSNFPDRLYEQGTINSTAYSIWVDDPQATSGSLLFGAVDTSKFEGNLTRINSVGSSTMSVEIYAANGTNSTGHTVPITYDSGDSYSFMFEAMVSPPDTVSNLPTKVAEQIWGIAGAYYDENVELAVIECSKANSTQTFSFMLSDPTDGPTITASMADMVVPVTDWNLVSSYSYAFDQGDYPAPMCLFGVQNGTSYYSYYSEAYYFGSTLLRSTYAVFDLVNNEIAIAPVKFDATELSNIVAFQSYGAKTPSATKHCTYNNCYQASTFPYGDGSDGISTEAHGGTSTPKSFSLLVLILAILGAVLGSLVLAALGFCIWRHRKAKKTKSEKEAAAEAVAGAEAGDVPPPLPPRRGVVNETGPAAPETQVPPPPTAVDKGKAPEIPMPTFSSPIEEQPHAMTSQGDDRIEPAPSRNV